MEEYDALDIMFESQPLSVEDINRLDLILRELNSYWIMEETKAKQRSRDRDILQGDRNTAYFHDVSKKKEKR